MLLYSDGNQSDAVRTATGVEVSGNGKPLFTKATVVLQSRAALSALVRTPPPPSLVIGLPRFDQKLDELTAERKAARCAAEAMANLSVLPAAMSVAAGASTTVDALQVVAVSEPPRHCSPLTTVSSSSVVIPMDTELSDVTDTSLTTQTDKYSSYDRHFKKKFFGSERRPQSSELVSRVGDSDPAVGDGGRDGNMSSPDVACKKARLAEPSRNTISPLCMTARTPTPPTSGAVQSPSSATATVSSEPQCRRDDASHASPLLTTTPVTSVDATLASCAANTSETPAQLLCAEPCLPTTASDTSEQTPATSASSS